MAINPALPASGEVPYDAKLNTALSTIIGASNDLEVAVAGVVANSGIPNDGAVTTAKIADSAITSAKIANGAIVDIDVAAGAAIAQAKISGLPAALTAQNPFNFGFTPTAVFNGSTWQSRAAAIAANPTYTGRVYFDSGTYVGTSSPTDMVSGDRWIRKVS